MGCKEPSRTDVQGQIEGVSPICLRGGVEITQSYDTQEPCINSPLREGPYPVCKHFFGRAVDPNPNLHPIENFPSPHPHTPMYRAGSKHTENHQTCTEGHVAQDVLGDTNP